MQVQARTVNRSNTPHSCDRITSTNNAHFPWSRELTHPAVLAFTSQPTQLPPVFKPPTCVLFSLAINPSTPRVRRAPCAGDSNHRVFVQNFKHNRADSCHGARGAGDNGGGGARAPAVDGGAELGDGGGQLRPRRRRPGLQAALPPRRVLLPRGRRRARAHHQVAQGPHVPLARRLLPRRRPHPPRRRRRRRRRGRRRGAPPLHQVQRLRRPHRRVQVRPRPRRLAPRRIPRPPPPTLLRQGARPRALLLAAPLRPGHELQMRRHGARVQLGAPHRRRGVGDRLLQRVGADTERQEVGGHHPRAGEQAAGPRARRRRAAALRQAGRPHRGPLARPRRPRHGVVLLPRHRTGAQEAAVRGGTPCGGHLRARLGAPMAGGGEDQGGVQGGDHGDSGEDGHVRQERQVVSERAEGRVRGGRLVAGEDRRRRAGGDAGQGPGRRRDRRGRRVPGRRRRLRRQPDVRRHGAGGALRAGAEGAEARPRGVRHGRRRRGGRPAGAAGRRRPRPRPRRHGGAPQGRGRQPPRRAREHAPAARRLAARTPPCRASAAAPATGDPVWQFHIWNFDERTYLVGQSWRVFFSLEFTKCVLYDDVT